MQFDLKSPFLTRDWPCGAASHIPMTDTGTSAHVTPYASGDFADVTEVQVASGTMIDSDFARLGPLPVSTGLACLVCVL